MAGSVIWDPVFCSYPCELAGLIEWIGPRGITAHLALRHGHANSSALSGRNEGYPRGVRINLVVSSTLDGPQKDHKSCVAQKGWWPSAAGCQYTPSRRMIEGMVFAISRRSFHKDRELA